MHMFFGSQKGVHPNMVNDDHDENMESIECSQFLDLLKVDYFHNCHNNHMVTLIIMKS